MADSTAAAVRTRSYELDYGAPSASTKRTLLRAIKECDGRDRCKPATTFHYSDGSSEFDGYPTNVADVGAPANAGFQTHALFAGDFNADGVDDILYQRPASNWAWHHRMITVDGQNRPVFAMERDAGLAPWPWSPTSPDLAIMDVDMNGVADIVRPDNVSSEFQKNIRVYKRTGANETFQAYDDVGYVWPNEPSHPYFGDIDGDGLPDVLGAKREDPNNLNVYHWYYRQNRGAAFGPWSRLGDPAHRDDLAALFPSVNSVFLVDTDGDARLEFLHAGTTIQRDAERQRDVVGKVGVRYRAIGLTPTGTRERDITTLFNHDKSYPRYFLDVNGDGLADALRTRNGGTVYDVQINTGNGFAPTRTLELTNAAHGFSGSDPQYVREGDRGVRIMDVNGDGLMDIVNATYHMYVGEREKMVVLLSNGAGFDSSRSSIPTGYEEYAYPGRTTKTGDFNGDGLTDIITVDRATRRLRVDLHRGEKPDLLKLVRDGFGATTSVTYRHSAHGAFASPTEGISICGGNTGYYCPTRGLWVVKSHSTDRGPYNNPTSIEHSYAGPVVALGSQQWLGFLTRRDTDTAKGITTISEFYGHEERRDWVVSNEPGAATEGGHFRLPVWKGGS